MNVLSSILSFIGNKIGSTSMGTTATTLTGAIAEHESDIADINTRLSVMQWRAFSVPASSSVDFYIPSGSSQIVYMTCPSAGGRAFSLLTATSAGAIVMSDVFNGGNVTWDRSNNNHLIVTNGSGSGARIIFQTCQGASPYLA